jgi:flagellar hook assembly protein FlgD
MRPSHPSIQIAIYDVNGRQVKVLVDGSTEAGPHTVAWDGTNEAGERVGSGMFWRQRETTSFTSTKKLTTKQVP